MPTTSIYKFNNFRLDCRNFTLSRGAETIPLQPRTFDTLLYLVEHAGSIVTKEELIRHVWADVEVQDNALMRCISQLRKALDDVEGDGYIRTIPGQGYQFVARVASISIDEQTQEALAVDAGTGFGRSTRIYYWLMMTAVVPLFFLLIFKLLHGPTTNFKSFQLTTNSIGPPFLASAISPDGQMIAFATDTELFVADAKTVERHSLPLPNGLIPSYIDWFPDGIHLLISINNPSAHETAVWSFPVLGGPPVLLLHNATKAVVSPDGSRIAFIRGNDELWFAATDGSSPTKFISAAAGHLFQYRPQFSADGRFIITGSATLEFDHESIEAWSIETGVSKSLFESKKYISDFRLLGNDELIIARYDRSSDWDTSMLLVKVSMESGALSSPLAIKTTPGYSSGQISATRDGNTVAMLNDQIMSDVYVADLPNGNAELSNTRRLTLTNNHSQPAGWLADNRTVLFSSNRLGQNGIYYQSIDSVDAHRLTGNDGRYDLWPVVTADQRWVFYFSFASQDFVSSRARLMRMPLNGGQSTVVEAEVDDKHSLRCATSADRCILARHIDDRTIYYDFRPETGRGREVAQAPWKSGFGFNDWDVSPDGTRIAFIDSVTDDDTIGIIDINSIKNMDPALITRFHIPRQEALRTLYWDATGNGFYISTHNDDQDELRLLHVAIDGSVQVLRQQLSSIDGWAIPSHDGKHLAFQKYTDRCNIWLLKRQ